MSTALKKNVVVENASIPRNANVAQLLKASTWLLEEEGDKLLAHGTDLSCAPQRNLVEKFL
jgi:hypothetical protein